MTAFKDTLSFRIDPAAPAGTLYDIMALKGVFALKAAPEANNLQVILTGEADAGTVLEQIRWRDGVKGATLTPASFHELSARIARDQGRSYTPQV